MTTATVVLFSLYQWLLSLIRHKIIIMMQEFGLYIPPDSTTIVSYNLVLTID